MRVSRAAFLTLALLCAPARAQPADEHAKALAAFQAARARIDKGDCAGAVPKLNESLAHEPSVGARLSLAECAANDPLAAWRHLREAELLAYVKHDDRLSIAHARAAELEPRLALLRVVVPKATLGVAGLEMRIDGAIVDRFYYQAGPIAVEPGRHAVEVTSPGKRWSSGADAVVGATVTLEARLDDERRPPPIAAEPPPRPDPTRRTLGLVLGGAGAVGIALGATFGVISLAKGSEAKRECVGVYPSACDATASSPSLSSTNRAAHTFAAASDAAFISGAVLLAAGVVLYLTAPDLRVTPGTVASW